MSILVFGTRAHTYVLLNEINALIKFTQQRQEVFVLHGERRTVELLGQTFKFVEVLQLLAQIIRVKAQLFLQYD